MFGFELNTTDINSYKMVKPVQDSVDSGVVICFIWDSTPQAICPLFKNNATCINPINWTTNDTYASAKENLGSIFFHAGGRSDTLFNKVGAKNDAEINAVIIDGLNNDDYNITSINHHFQRKIIMFMK